MPLIDSIRRIFSRKRVVNARMEETSSIVPGTTRPGPSLMNSQELIDSLPELIIIIDERGRVNEVNSTLRAFINFNPNSTTLLSKYLTESSLDEYESAFTKLISSPSKISKIVNIKFDPENFVRKSVNLTNREWELRTNGSGKSLVLVGRRNAAKRELSKLMRLQEQALEKENLALQQKTLQMHRLFIRSVCHEVRSPLSVVLNGIYMFEVLCRRHEDMLIDDTLLDIQSSCQSAVDLMESLLVYEQLESQTLKLKPEEMELAEFVESNLAGFIPLAKQWDVSLSYMVKLQGRAFVNASRTELGLTVRALVDNAMKYTPPGGRVEVNLYECEKLDSTDWIRVEVTDTGPGLSAEKVQSLFEHIQKFTPTTNNTEQGRGVAIYVIHGIVKLHGGKVGVASPGLGLGSSYFIDIPISRVEYGGVSLKDSKMIRGGSLLHQGTDMSAIKRREKSVIFVADISKSAEQLPATKQARLSDTSFLIPVDSRSRRIVEPMQQPHRHEVTHTNGLDKELSPLDNMPPDGLNAAVPDTQVKHEAVTAFADKPQHLSEPNLRRASMNKEGVQFDEQVGLVQPFGAGEVLEVLLEDKTELHLLLVDDVPSCRKMLARLLMTELCVCDEAKDGVEAVAKVKAAILSGYLYDGIFMDASMPNMTGSDATQAIRALGYEGRIFGVTGNSLPEDVEEFLFKGADEVKVKPLRREDMSYLVREVRKSVKAIKLKTSPAVSSKKV